MRVRYIGNQPGVHVPGLGFIRKGDVVEVPTSTGKSMLQQSQNWERATRREKEEGDDT